MEYAKALSLAVVQGITEFLPVSSSGHLVLLQHWIGNVGGADFLYDILLHVATAAAIAIYFRRELLGLLLFRLRSSTGRPCVFGGYEYKSLLYIVVATVPTAAIGLAIHRYLLAAITRPVVVGIGLMLSGCVLWTMKGRAANRTMKDMAIRDALIIGCLQGIAVIPGVSRSGLTIAGGVLLGLERDLSVRFSLIMSLPAILAAATLGVCEAPKLSWSGMLPDMVGLFAAVIVGYVSIHVILKMVNGRLFHRFAFYLWPVGMLAIFASFI